MKYGLSETTIAKIIGIFKSHQNIDKAVLYGSRAKGNFHRGSDIDLTLFGKSLNLEHLYKIEIELDDLYLPYKIDLNIYSEITNQEMKEHIDRVGITFYESTEHLEKNNKRKCLKT